MKNNKKKITKKNEIKTKNNNKNIQNKKEIK